MSKRNTNLEVVKEGLARSAHEQAATSTAEVSKDEALMFLGGIGAINSLTDKLAAQTIRALEAFGESKAYENFGYSTFAEFLDDSPHSPMTKHQYYDRRNALAVEGDSTYNLLNSMGVPLSKRKLLTDGTVHLDGDTLVVGEERIPLTDRRRVVEAIKTLAEEGARKEKKIAKGEEQNKKLKRERDDLKKSGATSGALSDYDTALINLLGAFSVLVNLGFELTDDVRLEKRGYTFEQLAALRLQLEEALGVHGPNVSAEDRAALSDSEVAEVGDLM